MTIVAACALDCARPGRRPRSRGGRAFLHRATPVRLRGSTPRPHDDAGGRFLRPSRSYVETASSPSRYAG